MTATDGRRDGPSRGLPDRRGVVGIPISTVRPDDVLDVVGAEVSVDRAHTVVFCNVHSVMSARRDPRLREALVAADLACPDGMPLVWMLRHRHGLSQPRVYGPDLMTLGLQRGVEHGWRHFLMGATDTTLERLEAAVGRSAPGVQIVGRLAPPFRPLTAVDDAEICAAIRDSGADVVWVGLGMPKQELWMHRVRGELPGVTLLGVGAAFDLLSGVVPQAPPWLQDRGLEWAYRLWQEPRRLWRRYLVNNPAFAVLALVELIAARVGRRRLGRQ